MKLKTQTGRLVRKALQVQSFNLNIEYVPGKTNVVTDMVSRSICQKEESCEICPITIILPTWVKEIREKKIKDENVKKIIQSL